MYARKSNTARKEWAINNAKTNFGVVASHVEIRSGSYDS